MAGRSIFGEAFAAAAQAMEQEVESMPRVHASPAILRGEYTLACLDKPSEERLALRAGCPRETQAACVGTRR